MSRNALASGSRVRETIEFRTGRERVPADLSTPHFPPREIYHALEAISDTSKKLFGDSTPAATAWTDTLRTTLLERGWDGFDERWHETRHTFPADAPQRTRLDELRNYLGNHVSHLNYAERLREGRSIGSGQIEGQLLT